jgi:hypothetical protein
VYPDSEDDPYLEMTGNAARGITARNIGYTIDRYAQAVDAFGKEFAAR